MKFTYKKFPILKELTRQDDFIRSYDVAQIKSDLNMWQKKGHHFKVYNKLFDRIREGAKRNVCYVTKPIVKIYDEDFIVADKLWRLRDEVKDCKGFMIMPNGVQYLYTIEKNTKNQIWVMVFQFYHNEWVSHSFMGWNIGEQYDIINYVRQEISFDLTAEDTSISGYNISFPLQNVVTFELFKGYAELETAFVQGKKKRKEKVGKEKFLSDDFPHKISIIDSNWFRTTVRTEGFGVKGHFRLQPCGEGRKNRKLIWVNDFRKDGYTKKAKMLQA